jgi:hypothetical protein
MFGLKRWLKMFLSAVIMAAVNLDDIDFTMFNEFVNGLVPANLEERSSPQNPKYYTTGVMAPKMENTEIDGQPFRRTVSLSITYLPVKGDTKALRTINKAEASLTAEQKKAKAQQWLAELEEQA